MVVNAAVVRGQGVPGTCELPGDDDDRTNRLWDDYVRLVGEFGAESGEANRKPGVPSDKNPRTGTYKKLVADGRDLHELHALMAPRPVLVSGGSEDPPERWKALNHSVAVNDLLGYQDRVAMTNRSGHIPTIETNEQVYRSSSARTRRYSAFDSSDPYGPR